MTDTSGLGSTIDTPRLKSSAPPRLAGIALIMLTASLVAGCSQVGIGPTPTPNKTAEVTYATEQPAQGDQAQPAYRPTPKPAAEKTFAQAKAAALKVPYKTLFRDSEKYVARSVYFRGKIIQVLDNGDGTYDLRVNVTKGDYGIWNDTAYLLYTGKRVLEDDIVQIVGTYLGPVTYTSSMNVPITIPQISVDRLVIE